MNIPANTRLAKLSASLSFTVLLQSAYGARTDNGSDRIYYGCFMTGGNGNLLGAQLVEAIWIAGILQWLCLLIACQRFISQNGEQHGQALFTGCFGTHPFELGSCC